MQQRYIEEINEELIDANRNRIIKLELNHIIASYRRWAGESLANTNLVSDFISLIFRTFFRWWWAAITGAASIASLLFVPPSGINLNSFLLFILIFSISFLLFLTASTVYQGWIIFRSGYKNIIVLGILKNNCYDGDHIIKLSSTLSLIQGTIIQLSRFYDGVEVPIALAEIVEKNSKDEYQAKPIWFSPGHLNDFKTGKYTHSEINATCSVQLRTMEKWKKAEKSSGAIENG